MLAKLFARVAFEKAGRDPHVPDCSSSLAPSSSPLLPPPTSARAHARDASSPSARPRCTRRPGPAVLRRPTIDSTTASRSVGRSSCSAFALRRPRPRGAPCSEMVSKPRVFSGMLRELFRARGADEPEEPRLQVGGRLDRRRRLALPPSRIDSTRASPTSAIAILPITGRCCFRAAKTPPSCHWFRHGVFGPSHDRAMGRPTARKVLKPGRNRQGRVGRQATAGGLLLHEWERRLVHLSRDLLRLTHEVLRIPSARVRGRDQRDDVFVVVRKRESPALSPSQGRDSASRAFRRRPLPVPGPEAANRDLLVPRITGLLRAGLPAPRRAGDEREWRRATAFLCAHLGPKSKRAAQGSTAPLAIVRRAISPSRQAPPVTQTSPPPSRRSKARRPERWRTGEATAARERGGATPPACRPGWPRRT